MQASILSGGKAAQLNGLLLLDVTPLTLGVGCDGVVTTVIKRDTTIPIVKSIGISTTSGDQTELPISVYEGDSTVISDCDLLGTLELSVSAAPDGTLMVEIVEVKFDIDAGGVLSVTATEKLGTTNNQTSSVISIGLSQSQLGRMVTEAQQFSAQDKEECDRVNALNSLEALALSMVHTTTSDEMRNCAQSTLEWLQDNQLASRDELDFRLEALVTAREHSHLQAAAMDCLSVRTDLFDDAVRGLLSRTDIPPGRPDLAMFVPMSDAAESMLEFAGAEVPIAE